jgi:PTS system N-acetylglucosamine-specific IIC component
MYAYSLFSLAFAKCPLNVFSALAFVSILGGFGKFTYLIGGIQLYKLSFKEKYMKFLQKLGKALMLPVAVLPICGILMGIGYRLCPATMQGGEISGVVNLIGLFLVKAGAALIDNMAILFAIGVGVGMSEKNDGTGGIAALASWLMITTLLSTGVVTTIIPSIAESATKTLAFDKIENPFIGILAGIIGSACYNRFKDTKLPDWLSFFSGKRCVAIVSGVVSIVVSAVLLLVWPLLFGALVAIGKSIVSLDVVGAGIYAFLNRLLIPTGLHHALNNVFWFDTIGLGDLKHFWAGETSADVTWSLGMYMSGFFPCMMFGIPGAALAMVRCAKPAKKKAAIGLVASAAVCAFICGVTEPFEFGFMFLAPALYVIYALLYGIFTMITVALGFRAGFSFSAGAMDLLFSSSLPAAQKIWLIIPLGIAAFLVFYFVFLFAIKKWDLKTPGREDDDLEAEKKVELASDNYTAIAAKILEGCGGKENITSIDNCVTRLRLEVKDITAVNDKVIKSAGVAGVIKPGKTSVQVIVGTKVQFVADAFSKLCE